MKILHIITDLTVGGAQENTILSAKHFNSGDNHSEIICGNNTGFYDTKGIKVTVIKGISNRFSIQGYISAFLKLRRYIKRNRFDIVHTHSSVAGILGRLAARSAGTKKIIHTVHGWGFDSNIGSLKKNIYVFMERLCARFTDRLIVVAEDNIKRGLALKIGRRSQYVVIRSGIDLSKYSVQADKSALAKFGVKGLVVGTVGRLSFQKCPEDFVRVAEIVCGKMKDVNFVFVGDGPLNKKIRSMVAKKGLDKKVFLLGFQKDVPSFLAGFDIFIMTSRYEGLPRAVLQARAAKKPVVTTDVDGIPEAVQHGTTGFIARVHDVDTLAGHILNLIGDDKLRGRMSSHATQGLSFFSVEKMLSDLELLYSGRVVRYDADISKNLRRAVGGDGL